MARNPLLHAILVLFLFLLLDNVFSGPLVLGYMLQLGTDRGGRRVYLVPASLWAHRAETSCGFWLVWVDERDFDVSFKGLLGAPDLVFLIKKVLAAAMLAAPLAAMRWSMPACSKICPPCSQSSSMLPLHAACFAVFLWPHRHRILGRDAARRSARFSASRRCRVWRSCCSSADTFEWCGGGQRQSVVEFLRRSCAAQMGGLVVAPKRSRADGLTFEFHLSFAGTRSETKSSSTPSSRFLMFLRSRCLISWWKCWGDHVCRKVVSCSSFRS